MCRTSRPGPQLLRGRVRSRYLDLPQDVPEQQRTVADIFEDGREDLELVELPRVAHAHLLQLLQRDRAAHLSASSTPFLDSSWGRGRKACPQGVRLPPPQDCPAGWRPARCPCRPPPELSPFAHLLAQVCDSGPGSPRSAPSRPQFGDSGSASTMSPDSPFSHPSSPPKSHRGWVSPRPCALASSLGPHPPTRVPGPRPPVPAALPTRLTPLGGWKADFARTRDGGISLLRPRSLP